MKKHLANFTIYLQNSHKFKISATFYISTYFHIAFTKHKEILLSSINSFCNYKIIFYQRTDTKNKIPDPTSPSSKQTLRILINPTIFQPSFNPVSL